MEGSTKGKAGKKAAQIKIESQKIKRRGYQWQEKTVKTAAFSNEKGEEAGGFGCTPTDANAGLGVIRSPKLKHFTVD